MLYPSNYFLFYYLRINTATARNQEKYSELKVHTRLEHNDAVHFTAGNKASVNIEYYTEMVYGCCIRIGALTSSPTSIFEVRAIVCSDSPYNSYSIDLFFYYFKMKERESLHFRLTIVSYS